MVVSTSMSVIANEANQSTKVVIKFIQKISEIEEFKEWDKAEIGKISELHDFNGELNAYLFELTKNGNYSGYVVVSAKKTNYPILEFSRGKSPIMVAKEAGIHADKVYYLGGTIYIFKKEKRYYDLFGREVDFNALQSELKKALSDEKIKKEFENRTLEAEKIWKAYEGSANQKFSYYERRIYGVPAFYWDDGCAPTAAAMVLEYWGYRGYVNINLPDSWYFEPSDLSGNSFDDPVNEHRDLTEELHIEMGTDNSGATWWYLIDDGINNVLNKRGYSSWASNRWLPQPSWSEITGEINQSRPFVLSMWNGGNGSGWTIPYGNHAVTVIGYAIGTNNEKFLLLYDTWDTNVHYLAFGNWWFVSATWVRPVV